MKIRAFIKKAKSRKGRASEDKCEKESLSAGEGNSNIRNSGKTDSESDTTSLSDIRAKATCSNNGESFLGDINNTAHDACILTSTDNTNANAGLCPYRHGTVYAGPYPGYVHANPKRGICPNGCKAKLNSEITSDETLTQTVLREAFEYLELYYHERSEDLRGTKGFLPKEERLAKVRESIMETGTYVHTFDELGKLNVFLI